MKAGLPHLEYCYAKIKVLIMMSSESTSVMTKNQMKCGIIYEKIVMWADDDERMIMTSLMNENCCCQGTSFHRHVRSFGSISRVWE